MFCSLTQTSLSSGESFDKQYSLLSQIYTPRYTHKKLPVFSSYSPVHQTYFGLYNSSQHFRTLLMREQSCLSNMEHGCAPNVIWVNRRTIKDGNSTLRNEGTRVEWLETKTAKEYIFDENETWGGQMETDTWRLNSVVIQELDVDVGEYYSLRYVIKVIYKNLVENFAEKTRWEKTFYKKWLSPCIYTFPLLNSLNFTTSHPFLHDCLLIVLKNVLGNHINTNHWKDWPHAPSLHRLYH